MTPFRHHTYFIVELFVHQSHIQLTFHVHQSECMVNTTKHYPTHSNLEVSPFMYLPLTQHSGENPPKITGDLLSLAVEAMTFELRSFFESFVHCQLHEYKVYLLVLV